MLNYSYICTGSYGVSAVCASRVNLTLDRHKVSTEIMGEVHVAAVVI
jgi:hypothetical protein